MRIAFATAQSVTGSTNVGRIGPLAAEFTQQGQTCCILVLGSAGAVKDKNIHQVGTLPYQRTVAGKVRRRGLSLLLNMLATALRTAWALGRLRPEVVVISKPLPANTLGVWLYSLFAAKTKIILDADDFELTANQLSSIAQRAVIHWSERRAAKLASIIVVASPFLSDHFKQLTGNTKPVKIIPTGIAADIIKTTGDAPGAPHAPDTRARRVGVKERQDPSSTLAYLGSISISSGHRVDVLPDILERVQADTPMKLVIAGDGDDVTKIKNEFERRGLSQHVIWFGRFSPADIHRLVPPGTIIIDPVDDSISNRAKSSFRVMLAAALGVPVVTSNIGIRPRLIPTALHQRFFADPANPGSYAEKIVGLARQPLTPDEQRRLQEHAANYTWAKLGAEYYEILTA